MNEAKREKREYVRFIFLWVALLSVIILPAVLPEKGQTIIYAIIAFPTLYVAATFAPLFRSWKAAAAWEGVPNAVEAYIEETEVVAEAKEMVDDPKREDIHSHPSKYSDTYYRLQRCADKHNKEAKRIEGLMDKLER